MARLIAEKSHCYGTRRLQAGDEYEASEPYVRVLVAARLARLAPSRPVRPPETERAGAKRVPAGIGRAKRT